jgi:hypothetical protein
MAYSSGFGLGYDHGYGALDDKVAKGEDVTLRFAPVSGLVSGPRYEAMLQALKSAVLATGHFKAATRWLMDNSQLGWGRGTNAGKVIFVGQTLSNNYSLQEIASFMAGVARVADAASGSHVLTAVDAVHGSDVALVPGGGGGGGGGGPADPGNVPEAASHLGLYVGIAAAAIAFSGAAYMLMHAPAPRAPLARNRRRKSSRRLRSNGPVSLGQFLMIKTVLHAASELEGKMASTAQDRAVIAAGARDLRAVAALLRQDKAEEAREFAQGLWSSLGRFDPLTVLPGRMIDWMEGGSVNGSSVTRNGPVASYTMVSQIFRAAEKLERELGQRPETAADVRRLRKIAGLLSRGETSKAIDLAGNLDPALRDLIPAELFTFDFAEKYAR